MFFLRQPTDETIRRFIAQQQDKSYSYPSLGATRDRAPHGYTVDHNHITLGKGYDTFRLAATALQRWEMFNIGWLRLCWPTTPVVVGSTVGVLAHACGLWIFNACRIVYIVEEHGPVEKFGFAYGTLPAHVEQGEERFLVHWDQDDDSVWYDILAISRPRHVIAHLGYPYVRRLQKRFARDSLLAMRTAVRYSLRT